MKRFVARSANGTVFPIMGTLNARFVYRRSRDKVTRAFFFLSIAYFFSPIIFMMLAFFLIFNYNKNIHGTFFFHKEVTAKYNDLFKPMVSKTLYSAFGYRIYPEEMEDHLRLVNSDEKEEMKELSEKGKRMKMDASRQFGFNVDKATRHHVFLGTTGAGKTETIMSLFIDVVKGAGGIGMVDGKSDQAMEYKIYNLCRQEYYETQFYAIILNKPEKNPESNTYSPLLSYESATKASEFLGEFLGGGGEGNADYFANRGKVMLGNIVMFFKNRQLYYSENFSISDLSLSISPIELNNLYYLSYGIITDLEQRITDTMEKNQAFNRLIIKAREVKTAQNEEIKNSELLYEYINQNSHLSKEVEQALDIKYSFFSDHYDLFTSLSTYIKGISANWGKYVHIVAKALYLYYSTAGRSYIYNASTPVRMTDIRFIYNKLKDETSAETYTAKGRFSKIDRDLFMEAMGFNEDEENVEKINQDAMQQHNYADQQWSRLFGLFKQYSRIFGTPNPEVDGEDIIKNNKVLYVMLPVLELSPDQIKMLGKMFILMFKTIASIGLGGDKQSATPTQFKIYQNKIKPNPIFLMVLDELGAYMTEGLSFLLSQVRSLRIAMLLSVQDSVSMKPGDGGENELKRIEANLAKIILQNRDVDTKKYDEIIPEIEVMKTEGHILSAVKEKLIGNSKISITREKSFSIGISTRFQKGMGIYIDGARDEPIVFQSYYIGDNATKALQIRRFDSFDNLVG